jgi:hypothetical protein
MKKDLPENDVSPVLMETAIDEKADRHGTWLGIEMHGDDMTGVREQEACTIKQGLRRTLSCAGAEH